MRKKDTKRAEARAAAAARKEVCPRLSGTLSTLPRSVCVLSAGGEEGEGGDIEAAEELEETADSGETQTDRRDCRCVYVHVF